MTVAYYASVSLALFAGALPAQILGVLWGTLCEAMEVEIPYIALLRLLAAAGAIVAVILSERIRGYILARDFIVGAIALEAMSLIGFSLSREFWNLGVWSTALGFSVGLCLTLICYLLRSTYSRKTNHLFVFSALGIAAGVFFIRYILSMGRSWRTACQALAILQIILCMIVFFLRRTLLHDVAAILKQRRKEENILRFRRREKLIRENGDVDERSGEAYFVRLLFLYGAALCCGLLLLCAIHLVYSAQAAQGIEGADLSMSVLIVCSAAAAGRFAAGFLKRSARSMWGIGLVLTLAFLVPCTVAAYSGRDGGVVLFLVRFGVGLGAGMIFPNLIQTEDERFDDEAQTSMAGLIPAFYLGAGAVITPLVQSMSGAAGIAVCTLAMLILAICMGICLAVASTMVKHG